MWLPSVHRHGTRNSIESKERIEGKIKKTNTENGTLLHRKKSRELSFALTFKHTHYICLVRFDNKCVCICDFFHVHIVNDVYLCDILFPKMLLQKYL